MKTVVGIFTSSEEAGRAIDGLQRIGLARDNVSFITPGASQKELEAVPTTDAEQPGVGKAFGGLVGGALGAAGGMQLGTAVASLAIPGVGPIVAIGAAAAALLGVGGAIGGAAAGESLENAVSEGLPKDELFIYEDALRKGRTVVIALARDGEQADAAREVLTQAGAESLDAAREEWWIGLRDAEEEAYNVPGRSFKLDESHYRCGFEAALQRGLRGKAYEEVREELRRRNPEFYEEKAFRHGYERGRAHCVGQNKTSVTRH
jgi:hypothetical protein